MAEFFSSKITNISNLLPISEDVYNGRRKISTNNKMFMDPDSIKECVMSLKMKNSEGYDRIPQRILIDGVDHLMTAFGDLFSR